MEDRIEQRMSTPFAEFRIRTNATRNSNNINIEVTTELTWSGTPNQYRHRGGYSGIDEAFDTMNVQAKEDLEHKISYLKEFDTRAKKE